jgi:hypothetical protein
MPDGRILYIDATWYDNCHDNHPVQTSPDDYSPWYITYDKNLFELGLKKTIRMHGAWPDAKITSPGIDLIAAPIEGGALGGGYGLALTGFTASKTQVIQNELFNVSSAITNVNLETFPGGYLGTALVDSNGNIAAVIGSRAIVSLDVGHGYNSLDIQSFVPETVGAGQYRLRIVIRQTGSAEWRIATISLTNVPNVINVTVSAEKGAPGGGYGQALTAFTASKSSVSQNELFTASSALRNVDSEAFPGGQVGTALVDANGNIAAVIGSRNSGARNPGSTSGIAETFCFVPDTVRPGQYRLRTVIRPDGLEMWRIATLSLPNVPNAINLTVTAARGAPGGGYGLALDEFTVNKASVLQSETFSVTVRTRNRGMDTFSGGQLGVALTDNNGRIVEVIRNVNWGSLNSGSYRSSTINCTIPNTVRPGQYRMRIVVRPAGEEWKVATLTLPDIPNSIDFRIR